ncbi:hypothetical protein A7X67_06470 [Clostridium sp. W14A]|nr:hypothetical protein A7X67_06470 [Clostridium sp. W14A]
MTTRMLKKVQQKNARQFLLQGVLIWELFNFRGQISEQITIVKIYNAQIQSVTQLLYCHRAYIPVFRL